MKETESKAFAEDPTTAAEAATTECYRLYASWRSNIPETRAPCIVYHYTTIDSLMKIIEAKSIWATDIRYLNDANEFDHSNNLVKQSLNDLRKKCEDIEEGELIDRLSRTFEFREDFTNLCSASFSEVGDDLNQWRGYARGATGSGVALGFSTREWQIVDCERFAFIKINYCENEQKLLIEERVANILESYRSLARSISQKALTFLKAGYCKGFQLVMAEYLMSFKAKHWIGEREWRLLDVVNWDGGDRLRFRATPIGVAPYVELPITSEAGVFRGILPLEKIVIGPGNHQNISKDSMYQYLNSKGYHHTKIELSRVPLRF